MKNDVVFVTARENYYLIKKLKKLFFIKNIFVFIILQETQLKFCFLWFDSQDDLFSV